MRYVPSYGIPCTVCGKEASAFVPGVLVKHADSICRLGHARTDVTAASTVRSALSTQDSNTQSPVR